MKKTLHASEQKRKDVILKRIKWKNKQPEMNSDKLVFIDESSINLGMTRLYGRAIKGERINDYVPDVRFERVSIISSIRLDGTCVPLIFPGSANGELVKAYLSKFLIRTLKSGDKVIMDNLSSHKVKGIKEIITSVKAEIVYLPPYSPDLNPIELMWSKLKSYLRKIKSRTKNELYKATGKAFDFISKSDIKGWFKHNGYSV